MRDRDQRDGRRDALSRRAFLEGAAGAAGLRMALARQPADTLTLGFDRPYDDVAAGRWRVRPLPGHGFVFTMYGCPGDPEGLRGLIGTMRERGLGNGLDPGPAARAESAPLFAIVAAAGWSIICYPGYSDMQVKEGRARLRDADEKAMQILDRGGGFSAIQLGEWGYYFHNLSWNEAWWRDVYGPDFPAYRHLMKPPGLAGYDRKPASRRECYEVVRDYFLARNRAMRGRNMSVTGHSHYEAYAAEWGALVVGLEVGENIAFTQSKLAFARGASRQWDRPFSVQVSPWLAGSCTTRGPLRQEGAYARGLDAGHSLSFYKRMWLHAWFAGAAMVTPENSSVSFFEDDGPAWKLSPHGKAAAGLFAFMQAHDRGVPFTPVAVVLDHLCGFNGYMGKPWGILDNAPGDLEVADLFSHQLFPGSDFIHTPPDPANPEAGYLRPTPYGEGFDVLLTSATAGVLGAYPYLLLAGEIDFDPAFVCELHRALRRGSRLLLPPRHARALGEELDRLRGTGSVEVLEPWTNPKTGRGAAIPHERLVQLMAEALPASVEGDPVGYQVNRNRHGWVVEIIHNGGVEKRPDRPAVIHRDAVATVRLRPRFPLESAWEWRSGRRWKASEVIEMQIGPGDTAFVELRRRPGRSPWD